MAEGRLVVIRETDNEFEAGIIVGFLASHGIEAGLRADDVGDQFPALEFTRGVKVLVAEEDQKRADKLLEEKERASRPAGGRRKDD